MTHITDLFPLADLEAAVADRLVSRKVHQTSPLVLYNYSERCQYEKGHWNAVTTQCRGLIVDASGNVVARPFRKFFNFGQAEAPALDPTAPAVVTDKLDGSLGILYHGDRIATRGSFDSDQAQHATALFRSRYAGFVPPDGWTLCFEIVYPENRIVLDYGARDDLILLGAVEIATGRTVEPFAAVLSDWPGPRAELFAYDSLAEALSAAPRPNAEGLVVHLLDTDERVKLKQEDYVLLHRIITGLSERAIWQHLMDGKAVVDLLAVIPDEFHEWVGGVAAGLMQTVERDHAAIEAEFSRIIASLPPVHPRKDFALIAAKHPERASLFARLDGKDYRRGLLDRLKPAANRGPRGNAPTEETA